jgi:hypothetical protein
MRQSLRVYRNVSLDAGNFFARIVALMARTIRIPDALRVNDQKACRGVASLFLTGLSKLTFLRLAPERLLHSDRARSIWQSTNVPCATSESRWVATATGSPFLTGTKPHRTLRTDRLYAISSAYSHFPRGLDLLKRLFTDYRSGIFSHLAILRFFQKIANSFLNERSNMPLVIISTTQQR